MCWQVVVGILRTRSELTALAILPLTKGQTHNYHLGNVDWLNGDALVPTCYRHLLSGLGLPYVKGEESRASVMQLHVPKPSWITCLHPFGFPQT